MDKIKKVFGYLLILIIALALFSCGALQDLWVHDLKNKGIEKIKSFMPSDKGTTRFGLDLMTKDKCKSIVSIGLLGQGLSWEEIKEHEKTVSIEVLKKVACVTKVNGEKAGMFLSKGDEIISVDPIQIDEALDQL